MRGAGIAAALATYLSCDGSPEIDKCPDCRLNDSLEDLEDHPTICEALNKIDETGTLWLDEGG